MNLADVFENYIGAKEWDETVGEIQNWYYGYYEKSSWCATSLSYMASLIEFEDYESEEEEYISYLDLIGGKNANVYNMMRSCISHQHDTYSRFYYRQNIPDGLLMRGDIIFWLWSGNTMNVNSKKHVSVCTQDVYIDEDEEPIIYTVGGNQNHQIKISQTGGNYYRRNQIYGIYRIDEEGEWNIDPPDPPQPTPDPPEPSPSPEARTNKIIFYLKPQRRRI